MADMPLSASTQSHIGHASVAGVCRACIRPRSRKLGWKMKNCNLVRISILFFTFCLPVLARPWSTSGPRKWFHNNHPERSNPHYKDSAHKPAHNRHRSGSHQKP